MFETEVFRKQMCCIEGSTCDIVGTFRRPHGDFALGELCPSCPPRYAPATIRVFLLTFAEKRFWFRSYGLKTTNN